MFSTAQMTKDGQTFITEASSIGIVPGVTPDCLLKVECHEDGVVRSFKREATRIKNGSIMSWDYVEAVNTNQLRLVIIND